MRFNLNMLAIVVAGVLSTAQSGAQEIYSPQVSAPVIGDFPVTELNDIKDEQGRVRYVVVFKREALSAYSDRAVAVDRERFSSGTMERMINLTVAFEHRHRINAVDVTSDQHLTLTTYLASEQISSIKNDPDVIDLIRETGVQFSAGVWSNQTVSGETRSWGKIAVNTSTATSSGTRRVYVIDSGVGQHSDLNVIQRVNPSIPGATALGHLVGCYSHGTHVAGIIGAKANASGTVGVLPGANIVSVAISKLSYYNATSNCLESPSGADFTQGLKDAIDWVKADIQTTGTVGIVNISMNGTAFLSDSVLRSKLAALAAPATGYPGAFVSQSAGNQAGIACSYAYGPTTSSDGYMVIGGINDHGQASVMLNGLPAYRNPGINNEAGTNYGSCVDAWAPSVDIYAPFVVGKQSGSTVYSSYGNLSGTSMAAPHVTGLAAYYAETMSLTTPAAIESIARTNLSTLGSTDQDGTAVKLPTASPLAGTKNKPFGEVAVSNSCFRPPYTTSTPCATPPSMPKVTPNGVIEVYTDSTFNVSFDSKGSGSYTCEVYHQFSFLAPGTLLASTQRQYWGDQVPSGNSTRYYYSTMCGSPSAGVYGLVAPYGHWKRGSVEVTGTTLTLPPTTTETIQWTADSGASYCDIDILKHDGFGYTTPVYTGINLSTSGSMAMPSGAGSYQYALRCYDSRGESRLATFIANR